MMDKGTLEKLVKSTALLWNQHKKREALYIEAMKTEDLGALRTVCNQGHFSALLFQKEIQWIYDYFKCSLSDYDLQVHFNESVQTEDKPRKIRPKRVLTYLLKEAEFSTIKCYHRVLKYVESDSETSRIMREHLDRIADLYKQWKSEVGATIPTWRMSTSVPLVS
jgi:hypothetical protein